MEFPEKYFFRDLGNKFKLKPEDYSLKIQINSLSQNIDKDIISTTRSGIILNCQGLDSALLGFEIENNTLSCIHIQGGKRRLKQLTPIAWDKVLLWKTIQYSIKNNIEKILIPFSYQIEGVKPQHLHKLQQRYEYNAAHFRFKPDENYKKLVLNL